MQVQEEANQMDPGMRTQGIRPEDSGTGCLDYRIRGIDAITSFERHATAAQTRETCHPGENNLCFDCCVRTRRPGLIRDDAAFLRLSGERWFAHLT